MTSARMQRMEELFYEALPMGAEERGRWLQDRCMDDPELAVEVLGLVEAELAISELHVPLGENAGPETDRWTGQVLGGFRLERLLGRGGMGVVYLASRTSGDLSQRAAVKLMAYHLQSTPAQTQFLMEREALAQLEHSNITRLLDGGVTPEGLPYLVMEYVEGRRLDAVCDADATTLGTIAELMAELCEAVSYVHRNLILHRDLKPGNVMVTDEGSVKLLDFGTLKGLGTRFAGDSAMTQAGMRSLTLRYASPEQINGSLPSTAMDVYSLGMILYRLIAGRLPMEIDELSVPEHLALLGREQFVAPSRVGPARRRGQDPLLAADLDAIALKAIRFRAEERYDSADELADDLRRALGRRPVVARAGTARYRTGRFLRRNRTLALGTLAATLVLGIGVAAMAHEAGVARAESRRANAGVEQERKLEHLLLFDYFAQVKKIPGSTDAQRRAVAEGLTYLNSLNPKSLTPEMQLESIHAYVQLGNLQDSQYEENLGDMPGALKTLHLAVASAQQLVAQQPKNLSYLRALALSERTLGSIYQGANNAQEAIGHFLTAASLYQQIIRRSRTPLQDMNQAASTEDLLGDCYGLPGAGTLMDPEKGMQRYQKAVAIYKESLKLDPNCAFCLSGVGVEEWKIGMISKTPEEAEAAYREGLASYYAMPAAEQANTHGRRLVTLLTHRLAFVSIDTGNTDEGFAMIAPVRAQMRADVAADPLDARGRMDLALLDDDLADALRDLHRYQDQLEPSREFVAMMDAMVKTDASNGLKQFRRGKALSHLGMLELELGRKAEGQRHGDEAVAILVPLAQKPTANSRILHITCEALIAFHPHGVEQDAGLALALAERGVKITREPGLEEYQTLAESAQFAGKREESVTAAKAALKALPARSRSLFERSRAAELNEILAGDQGRRG